MLAPTPGSSCRVRTPTDCRCGRVTDAGQLQQLGAVEGAAAQDHLAGAHAAPHPAAADVVDADAPGAVHPQPGDHRQGLDLEVLAAADRVEVRAGRGEPPPPVDVAVELREALLAVAVDVVGQREAGLLHRLEEGTEQRRRRRPPLQHQRPGAAAPRVGAGQAGLHPLEVRQAVGVVPALHARLGRPALVVHRVAALEDHPVDRARAAQHLAAGVVDPATAHVRLGLRLVLPVVEPVADRVRQRRRHVDEGVHPEVAAAGLEDQHPRARVGAEPVGQRAARRPAADDDVVPAGAHCPCSSCVVPVRSANHPAGAGRVLCQMCLASRYSSSPA